MKKFWTFFFVLLNLFILTAAQAAENYSNAYRSRFSVKGETYLYLEKSLDNNEYYHLKNKSSYIPTIIFASKNNMTYTGNGEKQATGNKMLIGNLNKDGNYYLLDYSKKLLKVFPLTNNVNSLNGIAGLLNGGMGMDFLYSDSMFAKLFLNGTVSSESSKIIYEGNLATVLGKKKYICEKYSVIMGKPGNQYLPEMRISIKYTYFFDPLTGTLKKVVWNNELYDVVAFDNHVPDDNIFEIPPDIKEFAGNMDDLLKTGEEQ